MPDHAPPALFERLQALEGREGATRALEDAWATARRLARQWGVTLQDPLPDASCCLVLPGRDADGHEVVLRLPMVGEEATSGYRALLAFSGHGGIQVLQADPATGAAVLPRLRPGRHLDEAVLDDLQAAQICADAIRRLATAPSFEGIPLEGWYDDLLTPEPPTSSHLDPDIVAAARKVATNLYQTIPTRRLVHGDLHHFNLLQHGDDWIAIDPKGVLADPAFECAAFMRNPLPTIGGAANLPDLLAARIDRFAQELHLPPDRIWAWSFVDTTASGTTSQSRFAQACAHLAQALFTLRPTYCPRA